MSSIYIVDDLHPEDLAMLQALYSRSPASVLSHLEKVGKVGSGHFMEVYYVGYSHSSIGDCGVTALFIEGVSMLAAKAIQDHPLYSGQEASTRYLDMSKQPVLDPTGKGRMIQDNWMEFYDTAMPLVVEHMRSRFPQGDATDKTYEKALNARAFDVMRGFLPAGCTTNLSWTVNLRQAWDHIHDLLHHPLGEIREIAQAMLMSLRQEYQHSFNHKEYEATEKYLELAMAEHLYDPDRFIARSPSEMHCVDNLKLSVAELCKTPVFKDRPPHCRLPHRYEDLGQINFKFLLDFGSFRDLQRHRNGVCRMPLLSTKWGFHPWYLEQLPQSLLPDALELLNVQEAYINALPAPDADKQHYVAMGYNVPCSVTRGLPATVYLIELRTSKMVHPTMRSAAQQMGARLQSYYPQLTLHMDMDPSDWDVKRGKQDIEEKAKPNGQTI